jgi:hypothetical protein
MRRDKLAVAALVFIGGAGSVGVLAATVWWAVPPRVHFVLPNQFRGAFVILKDPASSAAIEDHYFSTTLRIPEDAVLRVPSDSFFHRGSRWSASYLNGERLPLDDELSNRPEDRIRQVTLWSAGFGDGSAHGPRYDFFVGTRAEFEDFDFWSFKPGVGGVE